MEFRNIANASFDGDGGWMEQNQIGLLWSQQW
jgi:hypothetical protein